MTDHDVIIVGAGFGGMGAAITSSGWLGAATDLLILEREDDLGGTWHVNHYPGLAVDIASVTYSYSFEPNPHWKHWFARGPELKQYAEHVADKYDLRRHMEFGVSRRGRALGRGRAALGRHHTSVDGGRASRPSDAKLPDDRHRLPLPAAAPRHRGRRTTSPATVIHTAKWDDASTSTASGSP